MPKATTAQKIAITNMVEDTFVYELCKKPNALYTFSELRDTIDAVFGGLEFNWLAVVRSPMQKLINDGFMHRDTSDLKVERYLKTKAI